MQDIDLSGVDPRRWPEIRRRVAIIKEWIATGRHSKQEGAEYADRMGLSYKQFMRLVSAWKKHRNPEELAGTGGRRGTPRESRMPAATRQAVLDAITALGLDARFVDVAAEADRRCREADAPTASTGMVHYLLMRARQQAGSRAGLPEIVVGRVGCKLPLIVNGEVHATPELVLAVLAPEGKIVAYRLVSADDRSAALAQVLTEVAALTSGAPALSPVVVGKELAGRGTIPTLAVELKYSVEATAGRLAQLLGSHIGSIPIRHRIRISSARLPQTAAPLNCEDAAEAVLIAVQAHNRRRCADAPQEDGAHLSYRNAA